MQPDQTYLVSGAIGLNVAMLVAHASRTRLTLAPVFALAGVFAMMLWQLLQMGWWVDAGDFHFNAGLIAFIPPLLLGGLLCYALDGLRVSRAYLLVVLTVSLFSWGFSIFREQLGDYVPLPYSIALSNREHLSIILALVLAQLTALITYQLLFRLFSAFATLPALLIGISTWLGIYSLVAYGLTTGVVNFQNELPAFVMGSVLSTLLLTPYAAHVRAQDLLMPVGSLLRFFQFWRAVPGNDKPPDNPLEPKMAISELQMLNATLRQQQKLIDDQMEHSPLGLMFLDARERVMRSNPSAVALIGQAAQIGRNFSEGIRALGIVGFAVDMAARDGRSLSFDYLDPDRGEQWLEIMVTPLYNRERTSHFIGYHVQIKNATVETLARRRALITHRVRGLHETGRVIAHDFSNLLLGAEAQLGRLCNGRESPAQIEAREAIQTAFSQARNMLHQLGGTGQFGTPKLYPLELDKLLADAISITAAAAADRRVSVHLQSAPQLFIEGDEGQLLRVICNLLQNALRACENAGGTIDVRSSEEGRGVLIEICDTGCGMTDEQLATAFDPAFSTKGAGQGGLGLAISYLMIEAHGGNLALARNPAEHGTCARIWMPSARFNKALLDIEGEHVVLLIADAIRRQQLADQLEHHQGCCVAEAETVEEAIALTTDEQEWRHIIVDAAQINDMDLTKLPSHIEIHGIDSRQIDAPPMVVTQGLK